MNEEPEALRLRVVGISLDPHVLIYSTIILMTAYALYDEGTAPLAEGAWVELIAISVAPLFALSMAHAFSDALDLQIRYRRRLTRHDRWTLARRNLQFMYIAVPPSLLFGALTLLRWDANDAVGLALVLGLISLLFWGAFAGRAAGLPVWRRITFGLGYLFMGLLVILVELAITH